MAAARDAVGLNRGRHILSPHSLGYVPNIHPGGSALIVTPTRII